tara:strand:+ start:502 stop:1059 length:558 start_codon:yes stop_codon:yes gene_type:complete
MILPIVAFGSSVLRKKAVDITKDYKDIDLLISNMIETMHNANGVGLAAPQINKSIRLFIIDTTPFAADEDVDFKICKKVFINPEIIKEDGDEWIFNEGCLSIPNIREDVIRKSIITIKYLDANFTWQQNTYEGLTARVIQHEYDHINGILFTDNISPLRKRMLKSKLLNISKGKIDVSYKMSLYS